jgi:hypothetical protein
MKIYSNAQMTNRHIKKFFPNRPSQPQVAGDRH